MAILHVSIKRLDQKVIRNVDAGGSITLNPNLVQCTLIPNGDGNCTTDWIITGGGEIDPSLADGWGIAYTTYST